MNTLYLWIDLLVILIPLAGSFERRITFYRRWIPLFTAILLVGLPFIFWDRIFTDAGIWHFNNRYSGWTSVMGLPLAEWLFFISIPYACMYIYEWCVYMDSKSPKQLTRQSLIYKLQAAGALISLLAAAWFYERIYTSTVFGLTGGFLFVVNIFRPAYLRRFWIAYAFTLIPFFMVNGYLTAKPIVLYNNQEILGLRLYTIPIEDLFYLYLMLMPVVLFYESWLQRTP